jgi:hypothetical protein
MPMRSPQSSLLEERAPQVRVLVLVLEWRGQVLPVRGWVLRPVLRLAPVQVPVSRLVRARSTPN